MKDDVLTSPPPEPERRPQADKPEPDSAIQAIQSSAIGQALLKNFEQEFQNAH